MSHKVYTLSYKGWDPETDDSSHYPKNNRNLQACQGE